MTTSATRLHPRTKSITVTINQQAVTAYTGETIAAVLMTQGQRTFTQPSRYNLPRTLFCGMGICHQCLVTIDGIRDVRACMTSVRDGMQIATELKLVTGEW